MTTSSRRPRSTASGSSGRATVLLVVVLALVVGGVVAWRAGLLPLGGSTSSEAAVTDPASVPAPPGLDLPPVEAPDAVAQPAESALGRAGEGRLDEGAIAATLLPYLRDPDLGPHVRAVVTELAPGPPVYSFGRRAAIPASTTKLVTSTAALLALGPDHVFTTSARLGGVEGVRGRLTLVGGGDPFLERDATTPEGEAWPYPARADVTTLAIQAAEALVEQGVRRVRVSYDDGLFDGPQVNPRWEPGYIPSEVAPTSALWVDGARTLTRFDRVDDAGLEAATAFAAALEDAGVQVLGDPAAGRAAPGSTTVAQVDSAPLAQVVQRLLDVSDNDAAEVLLRHVGLAESGEGSIEAGVTGVRALLGRAGVRLGASAFYDGSGLSRDNRAEPGLLAAVLRVASSAEHPELRAVVEGLPVAGFTGSLDDRMGNGPAAGLGRVRAKTGTLTSVTTLAGIGVDLDGTPFVFALMADRFAPEDVLEARDALDSAAAALGACRCSR